MSARRTMHMTVTMIVHVAILRPQPKNLVPRRQSCIALGEILRLRSG